MQTQTLGSVEIIFGKNQSKVPYSTSMLIKGKDKTALIDCGGGAEVFDYLQENHEIHEIYLTHYHLDHIWGAHRFGSADIAINPLDFAKVNHPKELAKANGVYAFHGEKGGEQWVTNQKKMDTEKGEQRPMWKHAFGIANKDYPFDEPFEVAGETMVMLHMPGHCEGYCCPYLPEQGILYVGDFDLTSFGPWYNDADSDIDLFIQSAKQTLEVDADYFVTAHHKGIFNRKEYQDRLEVYLNIVEKREAKLLDAINRGVQPKDVVYQEVFYFMKNHVQNPQLVKSEILGIAKHFKRLLANGAPVEDYYLEFVSHFKLHEEFINYSKIED